MTAEILTVGTEILLGNIVNHNAAFLSQELAALGVSVFRHTSVGDNHERLATALAHAFENADIVITTGGLGPTQDDITKTVAAEFFGATLEIHEESLARIRARFAGRELPQNVERNALVPVNARVFPNDHGCAPGICMVSNEVHQSLQTSPQSKQPQASNIDKILIMLPGPPHEMQPMFLNYVAAFLREKSNGVFVSRTLKLVGIGETAAETTLSDLINAQTNPTIAPYAKLGEVHIRITASALDEAAANTLITPITEEIYSRLGEYIYVDDSDPSLAEVVLTKLAAQNKTLAVAESCTGGLICANIVAVSGCSDIFREGFITYSNEAKIARLAVPAEIIEKHGAVSEETAAAMAEGAARAANAAVGLSTTGIAGPGGGTPEKPVGLVYIGLHIVGRGTFVSKHNVVGTRNEVRTRTGILALDFLRRNL